ncbi:kinesin-like protein KIN-8A isoform X1 [Coffea eugenioides]|uniref:kinesin-like protein KIN-8A isoform X1 n=1 Tax=Coffea eugenioides TaxID=49369 RepID=UPI000F60D414|nr:kinesin-like protein KIN-8A isoform X1 [Coffea eugenioides]
MPVSTRSKAVFNQVQDDPNQGQTTRARNDQEESQMANQMRNPHHGLKEKMKALTLLYEQQKQASNALKNPALKHEEPRFSTHPSIDLLSSGKRDDNEPKESKESRPISHVMRENVMPSSTVTRNFVMPQPLGAEEAKENVAVGHGGDQIVGLSCPRKTNVSSTVARKLSMGSSVMPFSEPPRGNQKANEQEVETITERQGSVGGGNGSRILVFVRLRPMGKREREAGSRCCVRIVNKRDVYLTEFATENDYLRLKRLRGRHFTFDASFPDSTTQQEVYFTTTAELVEAVLQGKNGSVFCYGATGAGKTYTMLGTVENPGVMVLAIKDLFNKIRQRSFDGNHLVHLSYLEVYNETVRDLLSPGRPLVLREDKNGIVAAGLTQYRAYSTDEVMALLQQGNQNRTTEPTRANETSSRSHAILQVMIEYKVKDAANNIVSRVGKLSLIDLAGSERALATDQRTLRSLEGANINRSLLALSSCINALVEGKKHIPYRNSKLTQLLKDSLGGACNTVMIANISPSNLSFGETQNTLHWADRAKEIRTKACDANEEIQVPDSETDQAKLLLELQRENRDLRMQLARQQQKLLAVQAQTLAASSSPTLSTASSLLSPAPSSALPHEKRKPRPSFLAGTCFTPESKKKGADETVRCLRKTVKELEAEIGRMKKDHALEIKQKDDFILELSRKGAKLAGAGGEGVRRIVTRASLRPKKAPEGELKSPSHRFTSPQPTAKKRSFWDITTANSPSVATLNGRKTRSYISSECAAAPSMLLQLAYPCFWSMFLLGPHLINYIIQPGFARQRPATVKR